MKSFFLITFIALVLLSLIARLTQPKPIAPTKTQLVWTSDDNPFRRAQLAPFNDLYPQYHLELDPGNVELEKVIVQSLAGVGPDLFDCYSGFALTARGHKLAKLRYLGDAEGIMIEEKTGVRLGATDPRRSDGLAIGY